VIVDHLPSHSTRNHLTEPLRTQLTQADDALKKSLKDLAPEDTSRSVPAETLSNIQQRLEDTGVGRIKQAAAENPRTVWFCTILATYVLLFIVLRLVILRRWPLRVLACSNALRAYTDFTLPNWLGGFKIPVRQIALVGLVEYSPSVLDAWVEDRSAAVKRNFENRPSVANRLTYFPLPVAIQGLSELVAIHSSEDLSDICSREHWALRVIGEGGSGKTTLVCQICAWAMENDPVKRLCPARRMLPVFIEPLAGFNPFKDTATFKRVLRGHLQDLADLSDPMPEEFFERLLRTGRLLVVLDGVSEMWQSTPGISPDRVSPINPDFSVSALIITARNESSFTEGAHRDITQMRIDNNHLIPFINV
jgi:hypothetical protein